MKIAGLGCQPGIPHLNLPRLAADATVAVPRMADLRPRPQTPPIGDQKDLGSCTAWAVSRLARYVYSLHGYHNSFEASELFVYYNERSIQNTIESDSGASIDVAIQAMEQYGMCAEHWWPYDTQQFRTRPPGAAYANALHHRAHTTLVVDPITLAIKQSIAAGYPVDFGFAVYDPFMTREMAQSGLVRLPQPSDQFVGGHSCDIWGYDDDKVVYDQTGAWIVANQWGQGWGDNGYFYMPYAYTQHDRLAWDFRTIRWQS